MTIGRFSERRAVLVPWRASQAEAAAEGHAVTLSRLWLAIAAIVFATAAMALLVSKPAALTSDESLYYAEAVNIGDGHGAAYTTGRPVVHRPVLFPAMIAGSIKLGAHRLQDAYWAPRLIALAAAASLAAITWRLFGGVAGASAGVLAIGNRFLLTLGNSLYVDVAESLFLLLALAACLRLLRAPSIAQYAAAGLAVAAAFWVKESALLWAPLPYVLLACCARPIDRRDLLGLAAHALTLGVPVAAWWLWVAHINGTTFLIGGDAQFAWALAAAPLVVAGLLVVAYQRAIRPIEAVRSRRTLGALLLVAWCCAWLAALETHSWPYAHNYMLSLPRYFWSAGPNIQPFYFLVPASMYVGWRAVSGSDEHRLLAGAALLFLPLAVFTANRSLALRDALPLVYLALAALALALADGARWLTRRLNLHDAWAAVAAVVVVGIVVTPQVVRYRDDNASYDREAVTTENWDNAFATRIALWLDDHVQPGTPVMTSRLYYSSIFTANSARYPIHQLPTLRVQFHGAVLRPESTQFRWEDDELDSAGRGSWLYLRRYPEKGYDVGLAQGDLIDALRARNIGYIVITGEDAGFSSLTYVDYFLISPAFELAHFESGGPAQRAYIFRAHPERLQPIAFPLTISNATEAALRADLGAAYETALRELAPMVRVADGLAPRAALVR